jgi:hypothetical protein
VSSGDGVETRIAVVTGSDAEEDGCDSEVTYGAETRGGASEETAASAGATEDSSTETDCDTGAKVCAAVCSACV